MDHALPAWLALPGHGSLLQGVLIVLGTFVLEDAATVLAALDVQVGQVALAVGLGALYVGIVLGDIGLYGLGYLAARAPWARRFVPPARYQAGREWLDAHLVRTVFVSRFLPGARLPTYTACGFLGADLRRFILTAIGATLIWTSLLFGLSLEVGHVLIAHFGAWRWVGMAGFALTVVLLTRLLARLRSLSA